MKIIDRFRQATNADLSIENKVTQQIVVWVLSVSLIAALLLSVFNINRSQMILLSIITMTALYLAMRGILAPATVLIPILALTIFGALMFTNRGLRDTALIGLPLVIISASLMNRRGIGTIVFGVLSLGVLYALFYAEQQGYKAAEWGQQNTVNDYIAAGVGVVMITALQWLLIKFLNANIRETNQEMRERRRVEITLQQREAILSAVARASHRLLEASNWRDDVATLLQDLGEATRASHAYIFENHVDEQGVVLTSQKYEWGKPDLPTDITNPSYQNVPVLQNGMEDWYEQISTGKVYYSTTKDFPEDWRKENPIKTILDMPIVVEGQWWGVIGFDDCENELAWSRAEIDALQTAAKMLGAAIQRQQADQALRASESKFQKAFHSTFVPMAITRLADQKFMDVNNAFCALTGYTRKETIEKTPLQLEFWVDPQDQNRHIQTLFQKGHIRELKAVFRKKSGDVGVALLSSVVIQLGDENCALYTVYDITKLEDLLKELKAKNEELERFTYTVSHDLKAPLITIRGFLGYIEESAEKRDLARLRQDSQRIIEATDKMSRLLSELLELSRIGRIVNPPKTVPFLEIVQEALRVVEGRLRSKNIEIEIQPDLPNVYGDRARLVEVLQNLIDNAAKFMGEQPHPRIEIGVRHMEQQLAFYVKDNGVGIQPAYAGKIFGLFDKIDPRTEGTGIGLAVVKRIIEVHGGTIWTESVPGEGSTFYFTLAGPTRKQDPQG